MFIRMLDCVTVDHNPLLAALALFVALFSGFTFFRILDHARARAGHGQVGWSLMAAFVAGGGIWSTHFIAMLGFQPAVDTSYDVGLTLMSALQAMTFAGLATVLLLLGSFLAAMAGAVVLGAAIGIMHFTGMRALVFSGVLEWDSALVALSLFLGGSLIVAAVLVKRRGTSLAHCLAASALFGGAICTLHFTAMEAAYLRTDFTHLVPRGNLSEVLLGLSVAVVAGSIVIFSLIIVSLDRRAHSATTDVQQIRSILESAQIGILVCEGDRIVSANKRFSELAGLDGALSEGRKLSDFLHLPALSPPRVSLHETETELRAATGAQVDVAVSVAPVLSEGKLRHLVEVRDIGDQKRARGQILHLANHDALTGLPNRRLLNAELRSEVASGGGFDLLWLDLDRFKAVNDTHGHAVGDALLRAVAQRFRSALEERHLLARVGGDEFVVLLRSTPDRQDPAMAAESLMNSIVEPIIVDGRALQVGVSIGLASYPADASSAEDLMRKADLALYEAKRTGRSRWHRAA